VNAGTGFYIACFAVFAALLQFYGIDDSHLPDSQKLAIAQYFLFHYQKYERPNYRLLQKLIQSQLEFAV
jgi:aminopeptidase C